MKILEVIDDEEKPGFAQLWKRYRKERLDEFVALAKQLRHAQKEYFLTRDYLWLAEAKRTEKLLDTEIENYESGG